MPTPLHRLADIADIRPGYLAREAVPDDPAGTHRLLQLRDLRRDRTDLDLSGAVRFSPESRSPLRALQAGDVLFMAKGVGTFALAVPALPEPALAAGSFFVVTPRSGLVPAYLAWFLNHESTLQTLSRLATSGTSMPCIHRDTLASLEIPLPPLATQEAIAELDALRIREEQLLADRASKQRALVSSVCMRTARAACAAQGIPPSPPTPEGIRP